MVGEKIVEDGDEKVFVERLDDVNTANSHTWLRLAPLNREPPSSFSMVRKLKYHEQKLLKKVDFLNVSFSDATWGSTHRLQWKQDANLREIKVMRRYHIQDREDYHK